MILKVIGTPNSDNLSFITDGKAKDYMASFTHCEKKEFKGI
jgi:hypothetical protein